MESTIEITDNTFLRQFEYTIEGELATIEYSLQERKIFLTKLHIPEAVDSVESQEDFIKKIFEVIEDRNIRVMPTSPVIAKFMRKNRQYHSLLPIGVRI